MKLGWLSPRQFAPLLLSVLTMASLPSLGQASLIVTSVSDLPNSYSATVNWIASTGGFVVESLNCSTENPIALGCTPWRVVSLTGIQTGVAGLGLVTLNIQHMIGPHAIDVNPGDAGTLTIQNISPGSGTGTTTAFLFHIPHWDTVTLTVEAVSAGLSTITIEASHSDIPEPGTLALGALGGSALLIVRRFRRRDA